MTLNYQILKKRQRKERDCHHTNIGLRIHRALSWLNRAEQCIDINDSDGQFVFLWIAFNAAYANEFANTQRYSEKKVFLNFFQKICQLDTNHKLYDLIWSEFPKSIRVLLDNPYILGLPESTNNRK